MLLIILLIILILIINYNMNNKILEGMIHTNIQSYWFESYSRKPWKCVLYRGSCPFCTTGDSYQFLAPESPRGRGGFISYYNTKKQCENNCNMLRDSYVCPP